MKTSLRRFARGVLWAGACLGALVLLSWLWVYGNEHAAATEDADCAVVYGAAVWRDDTPSDALYDRVMAAVELYDAGRVHCLIMSGGPSTYGAHEVAVMTAIAVEEGVPLGAIEPDDHGVNTRATVRNITDASRRYIMVSNGFHLGRIRLLSVLSGLDSLGDPLDVQYHAAAYLHGRYPRDDYYHRREMVANFSALLGDWGEEIADSVRGWLAGL
ncbi:YdcF family protein [Candidatus Peribacteria bacterium]|nr:YdcF family protein [Candidatus Peribacteria bacterium]